MLLHFLELGRKNRRQLKMIQHALEVVVEDVTHAIVRFLNFLLSLRSLVLPSRGLGSDVKAVLNQLVRSFVGTEIIIQQMNV